jgi:threonine/homoserine/homoserine lactone efflux protein
MDFFTVSFLSFILTCTIIESTPGPNMGYIAVLSASEGRKAGFATVAGVALGLLIIGLTAALGLTAIISNSTVAYQALRVAGVLYLFWLAWQTWKPEEMLPSSKINSLFYHAKFFRRGLITNILNPKAAVFYVAILPKFITNPEYVMQQTFILTITFVIIATIIHCMIVMLAGSAQKFLENRKRRIVFRRILAAMLVLIAIWFGVRTSL